MAKKSSKQYRIAFPYTRDPGFVISASSPQEAREKARRKGMLRGPAVIYLVGSKAHKEAFELAAATKTEEGRYSWRPVSENALLSVLGRVFGPAKIRIIMANGERPTKIGRRRYGAATYDGRHIYLNKIAYDELFGKGR